MRIEGYKKPGLVVENVTITLLVFSPFFLAAIWAISTDNLTPILWVSMLFGFFSIALVVITDIVEYNKAGTTVLVDLNEGLIKYSSKQEPSSFSKIYFVGNGDSTKSYRLITVKADKSEEFSGRYYLFNKSLKEIRDSANNYSPVKVATLNGFQVVNRKLFGSS
ncbi:hypothetical protein [Aliidiomarina maris]|uniref:Uncharacterized protein n=1 Tax=Aliidiomarina maris TaxID=531312 RepID=A0A327WPS9_9GAMM|nr:hypothetical protein [Aliidiomarina maris]MCL5051001.1 hypothetical protein [Bacillota bacterium]RAJ93939.1 hypothetical protein B0I24_11542 [Aliidiomarina maris]RUO27555.1 hypothetical protein CWE07_02690 [Aliidiomarina maris]